MKVGDKIRVMKSGDLTQSYVPWGAVCEYVKTFDMYACIAYQGKEYLITRELITQIAEQHNIYYVNIGDLVSLKPEYQTEDEFYYGHGVIILIEDYGPSGVWVCVRWNEEVIWHRPGDLRIESTA